MTLQIILMIAGFILIMSCLFWLNMVAENNSGKIFIFLHPHKIYLAIKNNKNARLILIIGIAGLALMIGGIVPASTRIVNDELEIKNIVLDFTVAASSGNLDQTYQYFSSESSKETIDRIITTYGDKLKNMDIIATNDFKFSFSRNITAYLAGYLKSNNGSSLPFAVSMVKEQGIWKIMEINIY